MKKYFSLGKNFLFPICRSLTGYGVKKTLGIIKKEFPKLKIRKVKSGTNVYDWKVPPEWNVKDAFIIDKFNKKIIDFKKNNLHLVGYSEPINKKLERNKLFQNIHFLKKQPNAIPYITSYYKKRWGFCASYNQIKKFEKKYKKKDKFTVVVKSNLNHSGYLNYAELVLKGDSKEEILISTYICHPSMANNELSGIIVSMGLINYFQKKRLKKTLRFIFIPETIGSIVYLSKNLKHLKKNVIGGYNLSCIGDNRQHSCMFSKYGNSLSDSSIIQAYKKLKIKKYKIYSFLQRGSDERQYNSPGVDLPISSIFRTKYGKYPEYHTSLDNFDVVTLKGLKGGYQVAKTAVDILLNLTIPRSKILCEPQMSKKGLYPNLSTKKRNQVSQSYLDFIQYSDGKNTIEAISKKIHLNIHKTKKIYKLLKKKKLVI